MKANETKLTAAPKFEVGDSVITPDGKKVVSSVWLSPRGFYWVACVNEAGSFAGHNEYKEAELQPAPVAVAPFAGHLAALTGGDIEAANKILMDHNRAACANIYGWFAQIAAEEEWLDFMAWN